MKYFPQAIVLLLGLLLVRPCVGQNSVLSVSKIMQDPKWMGSFPSGIQWDEHGEQVFFKYNRDQDPEDSLYRVSVRTGELSKLTWAEERALVAFNGVYDADKTHKAYVKDGALKVYELASRTEWHLLELGGNVQDIHFLGNGDRLAFRFGTDAYVYQLKTGFLRKLTQIRSGEKKEEKDPTEQDAWIKQENLELLQVVQDRLEKSKQTDTINKQKQNNEKFSFYLGKRQLVGLRVSADEKYVSVLLNTPAENSGTNVPDYIDAGGYTRDLSARPKVGVKAGKSELALYDLKQDTLYFVTGNDLPGLDDLPDFAVDYPGRDWKAYKRELVYSQAIFSPQGNRAVTQVRSTDNKDRWIIEVDLATAIPRLLDRQRDEAWVAGPGIGWSGGGGLLGWLPDGEHVYFQSEESGYSHLYLASISTGTKKALTQGAFEVFDPQLSADKKHWYLTTSEVHSGERHFYRMPLMGGKMTQLTSMEGNNEVTLSPDEKWLAIRHSYSNKPWELYLQANKPNARAEQLTSGQSEIFSAYPWRDPQLIKFTASDGNEVPARLYLPEPDRGNGAAVIFVHGAGYLQNVHKWWSSYFREYMFHNLLADLGYTVLDIDYRGSAGYGRDWRTAIYRHMGGKDLSDQVDGAVYLVQQHGVDPDRIGIYGGSYGGFITLMALFNAADTFKSGAALRSVTDWAHYNHPYTANILNEPKEDPISYRRSSPIYFAEGLRGHLLMAHGMVDVNVHFQDVVRLSQRLIELGKDNWELAVYPAEDHGFAEPSSWIDEYKRILKLFNQTLLE
ncbi:S9 family peptidase [Lunatimonas salinarum]|uniref:S9 family peptidase n=1 Tax=Lunatimonas salinarum TaxID=1774590 RepID=UPI001AE07E25|nr:prolyl oligopeptidase family serine peptidase [Lunatimonas salinarum]